MTQCSYFSALNMRSKFSILLLGVKLLLILSVMVTSKGLLGLFEIGTLQPILFHCLYPQYIHYILHFACKMSLLHKMTTVPITLGENIVFWSLGRYPADPLSGIKIRNLKKKKCKDEASGARTMHVSCKLFCITVGALRQASSKLQESSVYTESKKTTMKML